MNLITNYHDSGKDYRMDPFSISPNSNRTYIYVKTSGSATGSAGMQVWEMGDSNYVLGISYDNGWSGWPFATACIYPKNKLKDWRN